MVFMFAANSLAFAQGNYKAGDKIEVLSGKAWFKAEVLEARESSYKIRYDGYSSTYDEWVRADRMRSSAKSVNGAFKVGDLIEANWKGDRWYSAKIIEVTGGQYKIRYELDGVIDTVTMSKLRSFGDTAPANNPAKQNNPGNNPQNQPTQNNQLAQRAKVNKFGTRDPRTCDNTKAPARGALSATLAMKYFLCQGERVSGGYLYLIENPKLEVGAGRPYNPNTNYGDTDVDGRFPIYPIRGSYTSYQCSEQYSTPGYALYNLGKNCNVSEYRSVKGECHKTTFGDWRCTMVDGAVANDDYHIAVAPPKP